MCDVDFDGYNEFDCETTRKARKEHYCRECRRVIRIGQKYTHHSALYDGHISTHKTCQKCDRVEKAHTKAERSMGGNGSHYVGELLSTVRECSTEHREYLPLFRKAWNGEELPKYIPQPNPYATYSTVC